MDNDYGLFQKLKNFNFDEFILKNRWPLTFSLIGVILIGLGVFFAKDSIDIETSEVEVLETNTESLDEVPEIIIEVAGAVESPGVFRLSSDTRIEDALIAAGGVSVDADRIWMEKFLNRAAKITDGQKVYIPRIDEQSNVLSATEEGVYQSVSSPQGSGFDNLVNINTATQKELESLWGIGPVYAQNIIEHRPYSNVEELLSNGIIKSNVYERNKDLLSVY